MTVVKKVATAYPISLNPSPSASIVLAGVARGGTTWMANVLNCNRNHRLIFEPLHPEVVDFDTNSYDGSWYIPANSPAPAYRAFWHNVLTGRIRHPLVDQLNERWISRRRIVKCVRANLMLNWLHLTNPEVRILYLLRHPFVVALSRMNRNMNWFDSFRRRFFSQPKLVRTYLANRSSWFGRNLTPFANHVLIWCVENIVPITECRGQPVHFCFYEHILDDPESTLRRLEDDLDLPLLPDALTMLARPSPTSSHRTVRLADHAIRENPDRVTADDITTSMDILADFGLDQLYGEAAHPLVDSPWDVPIAG